MTTARVTDVLQLTVAALTGGGHMRDRCGAHAGDGDHAPGDARRLGDVTLLPHQHEGARRLHRALAAHGGALLADEVGTGKTFTALAVARAYAGVRIVAPASLRGTWMEACQRARCTAAEFVSYERLSAGYRPPSPTPAAAPALLVLDEAHHARNPGTRRYRALAALARGVHVLLLTATPVHNRPRDLHALLALFLGTGASALDDATLAALVVRRDGAETGHRLPSLRHGVRHDVPPVPEVLERLRSLPPPVPPRDGGVAQALVALQLTRAWCSSDAALLGAIRRRLATAAALEQALRAGRHPARHDLALWTGGDDGSVQLAFPALCAPALAPDASAAPLLAALEVHADALRDLRALVRGTGARDGARFAALMTLLAGDATFPAIVFTHSAETAGAAFGILRGQFRTALLTGRGAWFASGPVPRDEVLSALAPGGGRTPRSSPATRIDVLVATDVVSEGVDLQRAATIVHLDLPWTTARLEQRVGRVRRVGSAHAAVTTHLIAPPAGAEELAGVLHLLARKASVAARTVGPSSMLGAQPPWDDGCRADAPPAPGQARERLIGHLRALLQRAPAVDAGSGAFGAAGSAVPGGPTLHEDGAGASQEVPGTNAVVACWSLPSLERAVVVALLEDDGEPQLLAGDAHELTLEPHRVLHLVEELATHVRAGPARTRRARDDAGDRPGPGLTASARALMAAVHRWCARHEASRQVSLPVAQRSPAHRRLLVALDAIASTVPRSARPRVASRAAHARALVLAQRGAGAEAQVRALARAAPLPPAGADAAERWLGDVIRALTGDGAASLAVTPLAAGASHLVPTRDAETAAASGRGVRLVAMLIATPEASP